MKKLKSVFIIVLLLALVLGTNALFTVRENEYACTVRFSKIISTTDQALPPWTRCSPTARKTSRCR